MNKNLENSLGIGLLQINGELPAQKAREESEALDYAEAVIESIPPFLVLDSDLRVKTANDSFCEHFKVSREQTENCLVYDLGNGQWNIPQLRSFLEGVLPEKRFFKNFEVTHDFESIGPRTILVSGRQVDHLQRILLFLDDVTDRLDSRKALQISETRYRRLFEAARDGILILDPVHGLIVDANPYMTELLGYSHADLLGKELWQIGLLKDSAASQAAFDQLQKEGYIRYENLPLETVQEVRREVEFVSNLYQENGHKVIQCNIRDITERKRVEKTLRQNEEQLSDRAKHLEELVAERTERLQEIVGELEAYTYSIAHDMRAPLRAMAGYASILTEQQGQVLDLEGIGYLGKITAAARRMDMLIQDVLTYTRVAGEKLSIEPTNLDKLVRELIDCYPQLAEEQVNIRIEGVLPQVLGNDASVAQCISNLLVNAVKFIAPGTKPRVVVSAEKTGSDVRLWIEDNGIGIEAKDLKRIFLMFERVHPGTAYEGTGIGLAIVRKAVERMGGAYGVESIVGQGSRFWIQLHGVPG